MGRAPTRRQLQATAMRRHIYDTAMRLMRERGYGEVMIADIVEEAKVSIGSFYHYYRSKDDIFFEIYALADDYFHEKVVPGLVGLSAQEKICAYFQEYARFNREQGLEHIKLIFNTRNAHFADAGRYVVSAFRTLIHESVAKGEIRINWSPEEISEFFFTVARGVVFDWGVCDGAFDLEERMARYIAHLARTIAR